MNNENGIISIDEETNIKEKKQLPWSPISQDDIFSYVLAGLDVEYILIVCDTEGKNSSTWHDVYSTLLTLETKLVRLNIVNTNGDFGANYVYSRQISNLKNEQQHRFLGYSSRNQNNPTFNNNQSQGRGNNVNDNTFQNRRARVRFNSHRSNNYKTTCQLYGKFGHRTVVCYLRFEEEFNNPRGNNNQVNNNPTTFIATPEIVTTDSNWLADSGAINHITNKYGNPQFKIKYLWY